MTDQEPIRILFLAANPQGTSTLRLGQEARRIETALENRKKIRFEFRHCEAARSQDLRFEVLSYKPHIVHFSGHGGRETGILLEDDSGSTHRVTAEALSSFFALFAGKVQCVFLNCCYSQPQAEAIARHIPFVIGTLDSISDTAAIEFSEAFYEAIGQQEGIADAFRYGIAALQLENLFHESKIPFLVPTAQVRESFPEASPQYGSLGPRTLLGPREEQTLRSWILDDHCRLVHLRYPPGPSAGMEMRATSASDTNLRTPTGFATRIADELQLQDRFDFTFAESLEAAPPITETLSRILSALVSSRDLQRNQGVQAQIFLLLQYMQRRKCLILLEDVDALLGDENTGYLPNCAEYADFFKRILDARHQSCVMVTSRRDIHTILGRGSAEQVRSIDLTEISVGTFDPASPLLPAKASEPITATCSPFQYQDRAALQKRLKDASLSAILRASERLPLHKGTTEGRLDPVSRSDTAPALFSFLQGPRQLLAIIGESGTGKTVLAHQIGMELPFVLFYDSHRLEASSSLTEALLHDLGAEDRGLERLLAHIDSLLQPTTTLIIVIDAINEAVRLDPIAIKAEIESLAPLFPGTVKLLYTCRKIHWESHIQSRVALPRALYHDSCAFVLGDFSDNEARVAFARYQEFFHFSGSYENLNDDLKKKVANPLMLRMLAEGYQGNELPSFAPAVQIFQRYHQMLQRRLAETVLLDFLTLLVKRKAAYDPQWSPDTDQFQALTVRTDPELATLARQQISARSRPADPLLLLEDEGILSSVDQAKRHYRFTYDRFYEYLLGIEIGEQVDTSSPTLFRQSMRSLLIDLKARHFSYTQALKSEIVRQTILSPSSIWSFEDGATITSFICGQDPQLVPFAKEVLRELLFDSSSDVLKSLRGAFTVDSQWLPIALDVIGDSPLYLLPLAVKGLFSGEPSIARRAVQALVTLPRDRGTTGQMNDLVLSHLMGLPNVDAAEAAGVFYYAAVLLALSEDVGVDCFQVVRDFLYHVIHIEKFTTEAGLAILRRQFTTLVEQEGPGFLPSESNVTGFSYLWTHMPTDVREQAATLPAILRATQLTNDARSTLKFFGSETREWEHRDQPWLSSIFTYRIEYRLSQWILIYHSTLNYSATLEVLDDFASCPHWLTIDFALCTLQLILLYAFPHDGAIITDGLARMRRWVHLLKRTDQFFDTFKRDDPFKATFNPLAQTAMVDARFASPEAQRVAFLDEWIGAPETWSCSLGVLAARQLWQSYPRQVLGSLRPAAARSEDLIVDLLDRTLREIYFVYPRLVERAFAQWGMSAKRAQSIRFRSDVADPTGVEFRGEHLYRLLFLTTQERRERTAAWYESLLRASTMQEFASTLFDDILRQITSLGQ